MVSGMGIPLPTPTALFLMVIETVGAIFFVHLDAGLTGQGGYELVLVLGAAALALGFNGGRFSLDHLIVGRRRHTRTAELQNA